MGNSEVGHLNLGAGVDRAAGPRAHRRRGGGRLARGERDAAGGDQGRPARAPDRARVRRRRALLGPPPEGADRHRRATGVVHAFTDGRDTDAERPAPATSPRSRAGARASATVVGRYFAMDRDKRGTARRRRSSCWSRARRSTTPTRPSRRPRTPTSAARPTSSSSRRRSARSACIRPEDSVDRVQLPARPDAPDHREAGAAGRPLHDARRVRRGLGLSGGLPARAAGGHARAGHLEARREAAARRGDGEVPARHVLLQRRRGAPVRRRGARARALPARRPDLRPQAGDVARARRPTRSSSTSTTSGRRSRSSTSPTRTWSGTRA